MKIPETYEEFLKTPKDDLKRIIESDELSLEVMMMLYKFNNQAIEERKTLPILENTFIQKNIL